MRNATRGYALTGAALGAMLAVLVTYQQPAQPNAPAYIDHAGTCEPGTAHSPITHKCAAPGSDSWYGCTWDCTAPACYPDCLPPPDTTFTTTYPEQHA